jgi:hypothetical protein
METVKASNLDELISYFDNPSAANMFGETGRMRLGYDASSGAYGSLLTNGKSADGNYYFALEGVSGQDMLLEITANTDTNDNGVVLNDQNITKVTAISSDNDAICSVTTSPAEVMRDIWASYPDDVIGQSSVSRNIEITIGEVTDPSIGVYTQVKTNQSYTWAGGSYPASSTDANYSDVVFDNSDDRSRQLNNIYLFYYPWYTSTVGNLTDNITINNTIGQNVNVFIIKQQEINSTGDDTTNAQYQLKDANYRVKINVVETMSVSSTMASTKLRTNLKENLYGGSTTMDPVLALNGNTMNADKISSDALTVKGTDDRLFNVKVTAYSSGGYGFLFDEGECKKNNIRIFKPVEGGMAN